MTNWRSLVEGMPEDVKMLGRMCEEMDDELDFVKRMCSIRVFPPVDRLIKISMLSEAVLRRLNSLTKIYIEENQMDKEKKELQREFSTLRKMLTERYDNIIAAIEHKDLNKLEAHLHEFEKLLHGFVAPILADVKMRMQADVRNHLAVCVLRSIGIVPEEERFERFEERPRRGG